MISLSWDKLIIELVLNIADLLYWTEFSTEFTYVVKERVSICLIQACSSAVPNGLSTRM